MHGFVGALVSVAACVIAIACTASVAVLVCAWQNWSAARETEAMRREILRTARDTWDDDRR
jgi:hypothetical protein